MITVIGPNGPYSPVEQATDWRIEPCGALTIIKGEGRWWKALVTYAPGRWISVVRELASTWP